MFREQRSLRSIVGGARLMRFAFGLAATAHVGGVLRLEGLQCPELGRQVLPHLFVSQSRGQLGGAGSEQQRFHPTVFVALQLRSSLYNQQGHVNPKLAFCRGDAMILPNQTQQMHVGLPAGEAETGPLDDGQFAGSAGHTTAVILENWYQVIRRRGCMIRGRREHGHVHVDRFNGGLGGGR